VRHRCQLVKRRTETKLRIRGLLRENRVKCLDPVAAWSKPWLAWLQQGASLTPSDKWVLKGIGLVTAVTLRAEIGRVDRFLTGKQLARFCGVTPRNASSGARQADAGLILAGNPDLRNLLIELAHRLIRTVEPWQKLAYSLIAQGKHRNVAVAAVANRWVRKLFHLWKADFDSKVDFPRHGKSVETRSDASLPMSKNELPTNKKSPKKTPQARRDSPALT
jgi:transposase